MKKRKVLLSPLLLSLSGALIASPAVALPESGPLSPAIDTPGASHNVSATITVSSAKDTETIDATSSPYTVGRILSERGIDSFSVKDEKGRPLDRNRKLNVGESLNLFLNETTATFETVEIDFPVIYKETEELYEGQTEVEKEGVKGSAVKTVVQTVEAPAKDGKGEILPPTSEEKITVVKAPVAQVVLKGTKERVVETGGYYNSASDSANLNVQASPPLADPDLSNAAVKLAVAQIGKPYVWGATGPSAFDCSGLIYWIYNNNLGKSIPRTADAQGMYGMAVPWSEMQPGDVLWNAHHIGIYVGGGQVVHASRPGVGVVALGLDYWRNNGFRVARFR